MTQNTQNTQTTTIERIATLIDARIGTLTNQHSIDTVARIIAAEIDGYIDTIAQLSVRHDTVAFHAQTVETALIAAAAERDEARDKLIEVRDTLHHTNNEFAVVLRERNDAHLALAAARAEVARLTPPPDPFKALWDGYYERCAALDLQIGRRTNYTQPKGEQP